MAWAPCWVDRDLRQFWGYQRRSGDLSLSVIPGDLAGWWWGISRGGSVLRSGRTDHATEGVEAADLALPSVPGYRPERSEGKR